MRIALSDADRDNQIIKTIHGRGFRFVADVISQCPEAQATPKPTVLLRPFRSREPDKSLDYFADGLSDDLIHSLSHHGALNVLSCNTSKVLGDAVPEDIYVFTHIVDGSVRGDGARIRVNAAILDKRGSIRIGPNALIFCGSVNWPVTT